MSTASDVASRAPLSPHIESHAHRVAHLNMNVRTCQSQSGLLSARFNGLRRRSPWLSAANERGRITERIRQPLSISRGTGQRFRHAGGAPGTEPHVWPWITPATGVPPPPTDGRKARCARLSSHSGERRETGRTGPKNWTNCLTNPLTQGHTSIRMCR